MLIYGEGRTYFAGADIREFGKPPQAPWLPDLCARIESSPLIVVSALHGTALGGGLGGRFVLAITGLQFPAPGWACPRCIWASCPARAAPSVCRA